MGIFDDLKITHTKTNVVQYNEYYRFGLQTSNSWTRKDTKNNYLYNSGSELNATTGWYETFYRDYDPVTGRFVQIDPLASLYSGLTPGPHFQFEANSKTVMNIIKRFTFCNDGNVIRQGTGKCSCSLY